jgi:dihydrofolate reductase
VRLGGGVSTSRQYLSAGLIDELHLAIVPVLLGDGENVDTYLQPFDAQVPPAAKQRE